MTVRAEESHRFEAHLLVDLDAAPVGARTAVAFSTTEQGQLLLASAGVEGTIQVWDPISATTLSSRTGHNGAINALTFATIEPGQPLLASAGNDGTIRLWDPTNGTELNTLTGHNGPINALTFATIEPGQPLLASAGNDGTIRLWDPTNGTELNTLSDYQSSFNALAFGTTKNGELLLASAGNDGTTRLWNPTTGTPISQPLTGHKDSINALAFGTTKNGELLLASAGNDGTTRLWNPTTGTPISQPLTGHKDSINALAFGTTKNGELLLASAGNDGNIQIWDAVTGNQIHRLPGHPDWALSVAFGTAKDGELILASAADEGTIRVWDPATGAELCALTGHSVPVHSVAFGTTRHGQLLLASTGQDGTIRLWTPYSDTPSRKQLAGYLDPGLHLAFGTTKDGQLLLASTGRDGAIRLWDPISSTLVSSPLSRHDVQATSIAFATTKENNLVLASACEDGIIRVLDPTTGAEISTLRGHKSLITSVAFGTTGRGQLMLASTSTDGTIRLWDPITGSELSTLRGDQSPARSVAFGTTHDHQLLLAADNGHRILVWVVTDPSLRCDTVASADDEQVNDLLGREILAGHLAGVLNQLVNTPGGDNVKGTVVVNIDGRWGSGKSVLARLTTERLRHDPKDQDRRVPIKPPLLRDPIVIWFNAWQQSTIGPRWWTLSAAVKKRVEQERAGTARVALQTVSVFDRLLRSKAMLVAGAVVAIIAVLFFSNLSLTTWDAVGKAVAGIAAVAVIGVGLGRVLFWASPAIGKLYLSADASPLSEISDIMARLRRWSPRQGQPHRLADTALAVWILLISGWMLQRTLQEPRIVARLPELSLVESLASLPWPSLRVPIGIGVLVLMVALSALPRKQPPKATEPKPWTGSSFRAWERRSSIIISLFLAAACFLLMLSPSLGAWTLPVGTVLILTGIGVYLVWLQTGCDTVRRPIVLVLDDLDRCSAPDTVEYLETIHTLMLAGKRPRFFARWRSSAPFIVLVLADGRWVRTAFEHRYKDFTDLGDQTRHLGADFLQKLFDHTVLVPPLTADQTQAFVEHITDSPEKTAIRISGSRTPDPPGGEMNGPEFQVNNPPDNLPTTATAPSGLDHDAQRTGETYRPRVVIPGPNQATPAHSERSPLQSPNSNSPILGPDTDSVSTYHRHAGTEADAAQADASEETAQARMRHLLADYAHILPANPRLIRRVVNAWGMLYWLNRHVTHNESADIMARAAVFMVRFPTMTDELLGSVPPITVTEILSSDYTGPWRHPEVLAVLCDADSKLIEPARLGRCFGRQYRDMAPDLSPRSVES